jgi:hypothetical protein
MGSVSLINGHIDDDDIPISTQISNLLEERYMGNGEDVFYECQIDIFDEKGRIEEHRIDTDIQEILERNFVDDFFIELIDVFDNPGIDCKCLCVSWIKNGKLDGFNEPVFRY